MQVCFYDANVSTSYAFTIIGKYIENILVGYKFLTQKKILKKEPFKLRAKNMELEDVDKKNTNLRS